MIVLVTGSRTWDDADYIWRVLDAIYRTSLGLVLHHGACPKGADAIADAWARERRSQGRSVLVVQHPARWRDDNNQLDRRAGFTRNTGMVQVVAREGGAKRCEAFIRERSSGATHCANTAAKAGIPTIRHRWEDRG